LVGTVYITVIVIENCLIYYQAAGRNYSGAGRNRPTEKIAAKETAIK
jgi:hypothetical protein